MVKGMDAITLNREFWLLLIFKSPRYTGGDFMFLYRCRSRRRHRRRPAADSCSHDNFLTSFWISFIFGTIVDL